MAPFKGPDLPRALLTYLDTVRFSALGAEGPRTPSRTSDANLDCPFVGKFVENALILVVLKIG